MSKLGSGILAPRRELVALHWPDDFRGVRRSTVLRGMSGAAALARAKQKREAAVAVQAERVEAEQAALEAWPRGRA